MVYWIKAAEEETFLLIGSITPPETKLIDVV